MASGKDEIVVDVKSLLAKRATLTQTEWEALIADLRQLEDEYKLARDVMACDELFPTTADAFCLGMLVGEWFPKQTPPGAVLGAGQSVRTPDLLAVEQGPGPHADGWRKPLGS